MFKIQTVIEAISWYNLPGQFNTNLAWPDSWWWAFNQI